MKARSLWASVSNGANVTGLFMALGTVTGTGFIPGARVLWNGVAFTTTFVDAQHLKVTVGANDVNAAGTASITCQNPGSTASNAIALTIQ